MTRVQRWERRAEIPLLFLAAAFLIAYAWPVLDPRLDPDLDTILVVISWTVWAAFAVDFTIRVTLADDTWGYARGHWYDLALIALPMLRPLRLLRLLALARLLNRSATSSLVGQVTTYVIGASLMAMALGSIAVLDVEQDAPGAKITTFGDALWWSATTVTTVGYGDLYPVTTQGPLIAFALVGEITSEPGLANATSRRDATKGRLSIYSYRRVPQRAEPLVWSPRCFSSMSIARAAAMIRERKGSSSGRCIWTT